jgi:hypothetical protein
LNHSFTCHVLYKERKAYIWLDISYYMTKKINFRGKESTFHSSEFQ